MNNLVKSLDRYLLKNNNLKNYIKILESESIITPDKIRKYNKAPDNKYLREVLYKNLSYEIVAISWGTNATTHIHDHSNNGCIHMLLEGKLKEEIFDNNKLKINEVIINKSNISYIESNKILHKITNISDRSSSLHIYSLLI
jgi:predicted metal-dependent enzyme (double-stranded beta helix superfamily)